jgi:hypothetical protein
MLVAAIVMVMLLQAGQQNGGEPEKALLSPSSTGARNDRSF